jgi:hypothetical protein
LSEVVRVLGDHGRVGRLGDVRLAVWISAGEIAAADAVTAIGLELEDSLDAGGIDGLVALGGAAAPGDGGELPELLDVARGRLAVDAIAQRAAAAGGATAADAANGAGGPIGRPTAVRAPTRATDPLHALVRLPAEAA